MPAEENDMANAIDTTPQAGAPRGGKAPKLAADRGQPASLAPPATTQPAAATVQPAAATASTRPARTERRGGVRRSLPWVLVALATAAAVVFALLWRNADSQLASAQSLEHERAQVVATGTDFLTALTNFSGTSIQSDVAKIRRFAVGDFAQQVDQFFGPTNVTALQKGKVVSVGQVRSMFVQSIDGQQASVFGLVDEAVRSAHSAPHTSTLRIDVEMLETASGWRVSNVDILESPGNGPLG
jgi:hypothetical protein